MINRYLIFAWFKYYPSGGMDDCVGKAKTLKEAMKIFNFELFSDNYWDEIIIYDLKKDKKIWNLEKERKANKKVYRSCNMIECDNWNSQKMRCGVLQEGAECQKKVV